MPRNFNGTTDRIRADGASIFKTTTGQVACSVSAWVKGVFSGGTIYADGGTSNEGWGILCGTTVNQAKLRIFVDNNSGSVKLDRTGTLTAFEANVWHHVFFGQDAASPMNYISYVDGILDLSGTYAASSGFQNPPARTGIGVLSRSGNGNLYAGIVAEVATWSRLLSISEIIALSAGLPASHFGPDHYWPLWGIDSPEPDLGIAAHVPGILTGTSFAKGGRTSPDLLKV
jgi:hypothetical protein